jgi:ribose/xylose/arabinose/galactoside ABC-type transport system permease subunit
MFLVIGNVFFLAAIAVLLKDGSSFVDVLARSSSNVAPIILAGLGLTGIIFTGAIDLSIASIIVVAGTVFGILVHHKQPPVAAFAACMLTAWLLSMMNGWLIRRLRIPAIILTLGGLALYRGVALILADLFIPAFGGNISVHEEAYHAPGKSYSSLILLGGIAGALLLECFAQTPRRWLALGNSEEACRLAGLDPGRILQRAFFISGIFLGLGALVYVTQFQAVEPARMALGLELQIIGAVILGGTNIFGGEGSYIGTVIGAFFLYLIWELLVYAGVNPYFQDAITGAIILWIIGLDCLLHRKQKWLEELA